VQPTFVSPNHSNKQYFPTRTADTSTAVGNVDELIDTPTPTTAVFQYGSNPILARVTTNKQFGVDAGSITGADRFQLAVYETEPVISNLDIYWETSHTGLISDLNAEALTGFNGPVALNGWNDVLNENQPVLSNVSSGFIPVDSDGVDISGYNINLDSVVDGNGDSASNKFSLQPVGNQYYIRLEQELAFVQQSPTVDIFTFTFTITDTTPNSAWGSVQLSETLALSNTDPTFTAQTTSPSQEYYYFFEDSTTSFQIRNFLTQNTARNGSAGSSINQNELVWSISGTNANLFSINSTTGVLSPSTTGVAAGFNTYEVDVTLKDANGIVNGGSVTQTYKIIKGFTPTNVTLGSQGPLGPSQQPIGPYPAVPSTPNTREFIYYIAANSLSESQLPGDPNITATFIKRFGQQALTTGAVQFGAEDIYATNGGTNNYSFKLEITSYYRPNSSSAWTNTTNTSAPPKDLNNRQFSTPTSVTVANTVQSAPTYWANIFYAQNTPGEYAWVVTVSRVPVSGQSTYMFVHFKGALRDLHYTGSFSGGDQEIYNYRIYDNNGAGWNSIPTSNSNIGAATTVYSDQPLAEYNTKFWTNNNLSTVYTPPVAGKYYLIALGALANADDKLYVDEQSVGNEIWGAAVLLANGEIQRTSPGVHVTTLEVGNFNVLSPNTPYPRRTSSTNKYYD
jgi:hypothetical protein